MNEEPTQVSVEGHPNRLLEGTGGPSLREALLALLVAAAAATIFLWRVVLLGQVPVPADAVATIQRLQGLVAGAEQPSRILPLPSQHMIPGQVPAAFELPSPSAYSSWPLSRYDRYASLTDLRYLRQPFIYFNDCCTPLINDLACRWVVAPAGLGLRSDTYSSTLRLVADGPVKVWENREAQPRARVVYQVRRVPTGDQDEVARILTSSEFRPRNEVVVPAGRSTVIFEYRPVWLVPGFALSLLTMLGLIWIAVGTRARPADQA